MKERVFVGLGGGALVLIGLYLCPPVVMELVFMLLCGLAAFELTSSTGLVRTKIMITACVAAALLLGVNAMSFAVRAPWHGWLTGLIHVLLLLTLFAILLKKHETATFQEVAVCFFAASILPQFLLALMRIFQMEHGEFWVLTPLLAAWGSDTTALFTGMAFGRHKLAPVVSPKKTVEGAVGGLFGGMLWLLVFNWILSRFAGFSLPLEAAAVIGLLGAGISQVGDLSFSIIKRQAGIKDYGSIFPGHGGVLDRFDSVIFVAPVVELALVPFLS